MNKYEKLGRAVIVFIITFVGCFAFSATLMVFFRFFCPYTPWETLMVCSGVGAFFGFFGGILGWSSEF